MHATGLLIVARDRAGLAWLTQLFTELQELGFRGGLDWLSGDEARAVEPSLSDSIGCAMRTTVDRYVEPLGLMTALAARVPVRVGAGARSITRNGAGWTIATAE